MPKRIDSDTSAFDAIKTMREIRDKMSLSIMDMDYEEEKAYLEKVIAAGKVSKAT